MADSIFTKIINGEIPAAKIYEDENVIAFLDAYPVTPGHTLVVPKKEVEFIWDLLESDYLTLMATVKKLGTHIRNTLDAPYVGVKVEGMGVPHVHVHLIPFFTAEEYNAVSDKTGEPDNEALAAMAKTLAF